MALTLRECKVVGLLKYKDQVVGVRFKSQKLFDISIDKLERLNKKFLNGVRVIKVMDIDGTLMSQDEYEGNYLVPACSDDIDFYNAAINTLEQKYKDMVRKSKG